MYMYTGFSDNQTMQKKMTNFYKGFEDVSKENLFAVITCISIKDTVGPVDKLVIGLKTGLPKLDESHIWSYKVNLKEKNLGSTGFFREPTESDSMCVHVNVRYTVQYYKKVCFQLLPDPLLNHHLLA